MVAVFPGNAGIGEPQVGLVDERRGLQRLAGSLAAHVSRRQPSKLVVDGFGGNGRRFSRIGRFAHGWAAILSPRHLPG